MPAAAVKGTFSYEQDQKSFMFRQETRTLWVAGDLLLSKHTRLSGVGTLYLDLSANATLQASSSPSL
jgi:hypothetical protein